MIQFKILETDAFTWLFIESRGNKPDRADLLRLDFPQVTGTKGVVISVGKLPVWAVMSVAMAVASHYRNRSAWQAVYDPTTGGAIVVFSLSPDYLVADLIDLRLPCAICHEKGIDKKLRGDALHPYCQEHQNHAPERQSYQKKGDR